MTDITKPEEVLKALEEIDLNVRLYYVIHESLMGESSSRFVWDGKDFTAYLEFIKTLLKSTKKTEGLGILYIDRKVAPDWSTHPNEIVLVEVGLHYNSIFHIFSIEAPWATDEDFIASLDDYEEEEISEGGRKILDDKEDIIKGFQQYVFSQGGREIKYDDKILRSQLSVFINSKGYESDDLYGISNILLDEFESLTKKYEMEKIDTLISDCTEWAYNNGLKSRTVALADIDVFLRERSIMLTKLTKRSLWHGVKVGLKDDGV